MNAAAAVVRGFNAWAMRSFDRHTRWHRNAFLPLLYTFLWFAALQVTISEAMPPMRLDILLSPYGVTIWTVTSLICPPMALFAWWLLFRSRCTAGPLVGLWTRLGAGLGELAVVTVYAIVSLHVEVDAREDITFGHWIIAAVLIYLANAVCRDGWSLVMVERLAYSIRTDDD